MSTHRNLNTGRYPTTTAQEEAALAADADLLEQIQRHARASLRIADAPDAECFSQHLDAASRDEEAQGARTSKKAPAEERNDATA